MNKKKILDYIILITLFIFTFIVTINHELWFDEAQSYLISKLSLINIIKQMKYEGHSCIFYYFIKLITFLGIQYKNINIISWLISSIASLILILYTDIKRPIKYTVVFSYPIMFHCTIFARPYAFIYLFIVLLIIMYKNRYSNYILYSILLFLLANTHLISCILVGTLFINELYELIKYKDYKKERITIIITILIAFILFFLQIIGALFIDYYVYQGISPKVYIYNTITLIYNYFYYSTKNILLTIISIVLFILIHIRIYKLDKKIFSILIINTLLTYIFFVAGYGFIDNKSEFIFLPLLFIYSISNKDKKLNIYIFLIFLLTIPYSIYVSIRDINYKYVNSYYIAEYIKQDNKANILTNCELSSINAYLDNNYITYDIYTKESYTYYIYRNININKESLIDIINELNIDYYITAKNNVYKQEEINELINDNILEKIDIEYSNEVQTEKFILYKVKRTS